MEEKVVLASLLRLKGTMVASVLLTLVFFSIFLASLAVFLEIDPILSILASSLFILFEYAIGPSIVVYSTGLRHLQRGENPWLESVVYELSSKAEIPMPKLAIVNDESPNAFVFGHTSKSSTLAVHTGLLKNLSGDEIKGVIGHELGHLKHKDFIVITMLSAMPLISYLVARTLLSQRNRGTRDRREKRSIAFFTAGLVAYLIYFVTLFLVRHLSRMREHYSDAYSAYLTGSPHSLASGLTKIAYGLSLKPEEPHGARAFYIQDPAQSINEVQGILRQKDRYDLDRDGVLDEKELEIAMEREAKSTWSKMNSMFSTHPPTYQRILLLRQIEQEMKGGRYTSRDIYKHI